jgi:hypothetical protein
VSSFCGTSQKFGFVPVAESACNEHAVLHDVAWWKVSIAVKAASQHIIHSRKDISSVVVYSRQIVLVNVDALKSVSVGHSTSLFVLPLKEHQIRHFLKNFDSKSVVSMLELSSGTSPTSVLPHDGHCRTQNLGHAHIVFGPLHGYSRQR